MESATGRPRTSLGNVEKYPRLQSKAAALLHSLITSHPFHNGNKRTGLVAVLAFLERNAHRLTASDDELFDLVVAVADHMKPYHGDPDDAVQAIGDWLEVRLIAETARPGVMTAQAFLECCRTAGCAVKVTSNGASWVVRGPSNSSVRFSVNTRRLGRNVVRAYLNTLHLSETRTGIHRDEFRQGVAPEQDIIRMFRTVLNRLAHA